MAEIGRGGRKELPKELLNCRPLESNGAARSIKTCLGQRSASVP